MLDGHFSPSFHSSRICISNSTGDASSSFGKDKSKHWSKKTKHGALLDGNVRSWIKAPNVCVGAISSKTLDALAQRLQQMLLYQTYRLGFGFYHL